MKITYDREVDALYIRFKETTVTTKHLDEGLAADFDKKGPGPPKACAMVQVALKSRS